MKTLENHQPTEQTTRKAMPTKIGDLLPQSRDAITRFRDRVEAELYKIRLAKSAFARW